MAIVASNLLTKVPQMSKIPADPKTVHDIGLSVVYESKDKEPIVDIIFVHGLQGHPRRTWYREVKVLPTQTAIPVKPPKSKVQETSNAQRYDTSNLPILEEPLAKSGWRQRVRIRLRKSESIGFAHAEHYGVFWPADLLPHECSDARILTFGYDSSVVKFFSGARGRPIIFVAHSLGGIVVKEVLRRAEGDQGTPLYDILESTKAVFFLGTPHRGSGFAPLGDTIRRVVAAAGFDTNDRNLRALHFDSAELELSREEFTKIWKRRSFIVRTFQEARGLKGLKGLNEKVVPDFSSLLDDPLEQAEHIDANHMEMCRFTNRLDPGYQQVGGELRGIVESLRQEKSEPQLPQQDEFSAEERGCLQSLSFRGMDARLHSIPTAISRTCEWLFEHPEYRSWIGLDQEEKSGGLLWIKGKPGAGKSTLMKAMLCRSDLRSNSSEVVKVGFFFNSLGGLLEKSPLGLLRSLLLQILQHDRNLLRGFLHLYRKKISLHGPNWEWYAGELADYFISAVANERHNGSTIIIIDALDECEETRARELVAFFQTLISSSSADNQSKVRICLSSRYYPNIHVDNCREFRMDEFNDQDIRTYVETRLDLQSAKSGFFHGVFNLVTEIVRKAAGVFLWVVLVVKKLVKARDEGEPISRMEEIVQDVPDQLNDLIWQIIQSVDSRSCRETLRILQWVLLAERPLNTTELRYALEFGAGRATSSQDEIVKSSTFIPHDDQMERYILSRTKGLVEVKHHSRGVANPLRSKTESTEKYAGTVQFIHEAVRDVLLNHRGLQTLENSLKNFEIDQGHNYITKACVHYLKIEEFRGMPDTRTEPRVMGCIQADEEFQTLCITHPFLEYAVTSVFYHARIVDLSHGGNSDFSKTIMEEIQRLFRVWRYLSDLKKKGRYREVDGPHTTFAHICAEYDMVNWVMALLQQGLDVNVSGGRFHTLIQTAAAMGHEDLTQKLLEYGADVHLYGGRHGYALTAAAHCGKPAIFKAIIAKNPDINAQGGEHKTALQAAAVSLGEDETVVQMLLDLNADVNIQGGRHGSALQASAFKGNERVVGLLLNAGASINAQGGEHGSALQAAAFQGHDAVVRRLLASGADPNIEAGNYGTALWAAAYNGNDAIVRHLLETDLNLRNCYRGFEGKGCGITSGSISHTVQRVLDTAEAIKMLHKAVDRGDTIEVQQHFSRGIDVNARGGDLSSVWHTAAFDGRSDLMSILLIQPNPRPDMKDSQGRTPLWCAASQGHEEVVVQLMNSKLVDYNAKTRSGRNLLWYPASYGYENIVRLLLAKGTSPYEVDEDGVSPLRVAEKEGHLRVVDLFSKVQSIE